MAKQFRIVGKGKGPLSITTGNLLKVPGESDLSATQSASGIFIQPNNGEGIMLPLVTQSLAGLMSPLDKLTLDNLSEDTGVEVGLSRAIESNITAGGISPGENFALETPFTDMWEALLVTKGISGLGYTGSPADSIVAVGTIVNITKFYWTLLGNVENLRLRDSIGQYDETVTGEEVNVGEAYQSTIARTITWTLSGDGVGSTTDRLQYVYPTYYGKNTTGDVPNETEIKNGSSVARVVSSEISVNINTAITQFGWIAVETTQASPYQIWYITDLNTEAITTDGTGFITRQAATVSVDGRNYYIYMYNYSTEVTTLKLT